MQEDRGAGHFIVVEGPDGVGKTTAVHGLATRLERELSREVVCVREPGGTELGERVRQLLVEFGGGDGLVDLFLFSAARRQLLSDVVRPALERGAIVLSDRFLMSTFAYQGAGLGVPDSAVAVVSELAVAGCEPNMVLLLRLDERERERRLGRRGGGRAQYEEPGFLARVRRRYDQLAEQWEGVRVVSASGTPEEVVERLMAVVTPIVSIAPNSQSVTVTTRGTGRHGPL